MSTAARAAVERHMTELAAVAHRVAADLSEPTAAIAQLVLEVVQKGGKLLFCGNGGSAADAQHLATEYVVRFRRSRRAIAAMALTTDTSLLTAAANDLGFERVFARQLEALGRPGDILFLHTTSGESPNLIAAAATARTLGIVTVGMLGRGGGRLRELVDHAIIIPTESGAHAQELHLALGHVICDIVESRFGDSESAPVAQLDDDTLALLREARSAEKRQALFYRALAAAAEDADEEGLSERLNGMHADEQHHLSRITVRLMELEQPVDEVAGESVAAVQLEGWEDLARGREAEEIARYAALLKRELDDKTRNMIEQFIEAERHHSINLGGKYMGAEPW
jgi:D-sedoheptulose 7-phosphate isomerase